MAADHPSSENHLPGHPSAEVDVVPGGRVAMVGIIALVVFAIGAVAAGLGMVELRRELQPQGPPPTPAAAGQSKIGIVEQRLLELSNQGISWKEYADRRLGSTGWVNREQGLVHVPIDQAMERVVKGERP